MQQERAWQSNSISSSVSAATAATRAFQSHGSLQETFAPPARRDWIKQPAEYVQQHKSSQTRKEDPEETRHLVLRARLKPPLYSLRVPPKKERKKPAVKQPELSSDEESEKEDQENEKKENQNDEVNETILNKELNETKSTTENEKSVTFQESVQGTCLAQTPFPLPPSSSEPVKTKSLKKTKKIRGGQINQPVPVPVASSILDFDEKFIADIRRFRVEHVDPFIKEALLPKSENDREPVTLSHDSVVAKPIPAQLLDEDKHYYYQGYFSVSDRLYYIRRSQTLPLDSMLTEEKEQFNQDDLFENDFPIKISIAWDKFDRTRQAPPKPQSGRHYNPQNAAAIGAYCHAGYLPFLEESFKRNRLRGTKAAGLPHINKPIARMAAPIHRHF